MSCPPPHTTRFWTLELSRWKNHLFHLLCFSDKVSRHVSAIPKCPELLRRFGWRQCYISLEKTVLETLLVTSFGHLISFLVLSSSLGHHGHILNCTHLYIHLEPVSPFFFLILILTASDPFILNCGLPTHPSSRPICHPPPTTLEGKNKNKQSLAQDTLGASELPCAVIPTSVLFLKIKTSLNPSS